MTGSEVVITGPVTSQFSKSSKVVVQHNAPLSIATSNGVMGGDKKGKIFISNSEALI